METRARASSSKRDRSVEVAVASSKRKDHVTPAGEAREARLMAARGGDAREDKHSEMLMDEMAPEEHAMDANMYRKNWTRSFGHTIGDFEEATRIPPMRFTHVSPASSGAHKSHSLQIFSVKVAELKGGAQWPVHVFGTVALRDVVDLRRIVIFNRERDSSQILTPMDRSLTLTGPTRAVMFLEYVNFEVELKIKGPTESEDQDMSYLIVPFGHDHPRYSCLRRRAFNGNLCMLEFTYGHLPFSVEATISVQVIHGSWHGFGGEIFACTASIPEEVMLLDSGDEEMPVTDGKIDLSRKVVSVEHKGKLKVFAKAWSGHRGNSVVMKEKEFTPKEAGSSHGYLNVGFCRMKVTVAWSLMAV